MTEKDAPPVPPRSRRTAAAECAPPGWYGRAGVLAMFLLFAARPGRGAGEALGLPLLPLLSLGEWLLLPLGVLSLSMGLLPLSRVRGRTLLPLWLAAVFPALLWLAAAGAALLLSGAGAPGADFLFPRAVRLVFPALAFLPLLAARVWRDRLMWALALSLAANAVLVFLQSRELGAAFPDPRILGLGGLLANQYDHSLLAAVALPLLAAWRGGEGGGRNKGFAMLLATFLLPAVVFSATYAWVGLAAAGAGLLVAWTAWRSHGWVPGIFLALLVFGYGAEASREREEARRQLLGDSAMLDGAAYERAFESLRSSPYFGSGPEAFRRGDAPEPWYATLLGGAGLAGFGLWLALLAELAARAMGRAGGRRLWCGGVLGGVAGLGIAGLWTDCLPAGAGAMAGLLLALSILEEPEGRKKEKEKE